MASCACAPSRRTTRISSAPRSRWPTECMKINELILSVYGDFGFDKHRRETLDAAGKARRYRRDVGPRRGGDDPRARRDPARHGNIVTTAINPGEGAFYGPKFEYVLRDAIGREWQCGTTQVDFNLPERFGAFYIAREQREDDAGDDPSRDLRLDGALHRHPDRASRRPSAAVAVAVADVVCTITQDADEYAHELIAAARKRGPARRGRSDATRRSTTKCASTRWRKCRCCSSSAARRRRKALCRSAGSARRRRCRWARRGAQRARRRGDAAGRAARARRGAARSGGVRAERKRFLSGRSYRAPICT